jgi:PKD repeat protein
MGTISFLPVASFTASPTTGNHPLNVKFNDKSTDVYYWSWDFGDKTTSTLQSPTHKYPKAGKYTVSLTVKNAAGKNTMKKTNYITVK